jgi:MFS family permease
MAFLASIFNMGIFSLYFIQSRLGIEGEQAAGPGAFFMALLGILLASSTLPSGWLADHFGKKPMVALGCLAAAVGTAILLSSRQMAAILMGGALIGIGAGIVYATSWALGVDLVPPDQAGKYLGIQNLAAAGAGAVGAYLGGPVADCFSRSFPGLPGIGYSVLYAMFGVLLLVSAAALWRVKVTINTRNVNQDVQRQEGGG